jgi:hypothetical protein
MTSTLQRAAPTFFPLICHVQSPQTAVRTLRASAHRGAAGLALRYVLDGDTSRLRIAALAPARAADELWRHTCFEAFVAASDGTAYHEFNFSPSREWAAYAFRNYRERGADLPQLDPGIEVHIDAARLELTATIGNRLLPTTPGVLRMGLCAVIEDAAGTLSYWALRHATEKPDFHQRTAFTVELA